MTSHPPPYTPLKSTDYPPQKQNGAESTEASGNEKQGIYPMMKSPSRGYNSTDGAIVTQPQPGMTTVVCEEEYPSNTGALVASWAVCFFCCCLFGIIGMIYAASAPGSGSPQEARRRIRIALQLSVAGLIIGCILYVTGTILRVTVDLH